MPQSETLKKVFFIIYRQFPAFSFAVNQISMHSGFLWLITKGPTSALVDFLTR
jgi:hypothetical protein